MELFINGIGVLSPQASLTEPDFTLDKLNLSNVSRLKCVEPVYADYIAPAALRRLSRIIKMGITAAKISLKEADCSNPDAILTATGLGCLEDTEKFVCSIDDNNEQLLTPTPFIQSTHNTVGGQIALVLGCHNYNSTYVHRGNSFESALVDASMLLQEQKAKTILLGAIDELTDSSYQLFQQLGVYKQENSLPNKGADYAGEGATFFVLSDKQTTSSYAKISSIRMLTGKVKHDSIEAIVKENINQLKVSVDLVLSGNSQDKNTNNYFQKISSSLFKNIPTVSFKNYCGEYPTSTAFAVALASKLIRHSPSKYESIVICNDFAGEDFSFIVVQKC